MSSQFHKIQRNQSEALFLLFITDKLYSPWKKAFEQIIRVVMLKKKYSLLQLDMYFIYLNILELLSDVHKKYTEVPLTELKDVLADQNKVICEILQQNLHKLSQQQQDDIGNEIKRMNSTVVLAKIMSNSSYVANKNLPNVIDLANKAKSIILNWGIYEDDKATDALKEFQKAINVSGIVTKAERDLIIRALGAKAGSWYKCPNGHIYHIGDCGGAMATSKCAECGAAIGGENHRLLATNAHAAEFDNSTRAAWPPGH